jgi:hypothetical protein
MHSIEIRADQEKNKGKCNIFIVHLGSEQMEKGNRENRSVTFTGDGKGLG